jgi:hypothetical protein
MRNIVEKWLNGLSPEAGPDEFDTKKLLALCGIPAPPGIRLQPGETSMRPPFTPPYVAKVCSPDILHKSDKGAVVLNLNDESLQETVDELRTRFPGAAVIIEKQIYYVGPEFIVGALIDPTFGPAVMVGGGGVLTEIYKDAAFRLAPCTSTQALAMLEELTLAPVFSGFRSSQLDPLGLAEIISKVGDLVVTLGSLFSQLDINPLVHASGRWIALDAALILDYSKSDQE